MAKPWYQSATVWFNVLALVLMVLTAPEVVQVLPAGWLQPIAAVTAIGNFLLRFRTQVPITSAGKAREAKRSGRSRVPYV